MTLAQTPAVRRTLQLRLATTRTPARSLRLASTAGPATTATAESVATTSAASVKGTMTKKQEKCTNKESTHYLPFTVDGLEALARMLCVRSALAKAA